MSKQRVFSGEFKEQAVLKGESGVAQSLGGSETLRLFMPLRDGRGYNPRAGHGCGGWFCPIGSSF
jgi:hypothetical protein